MPCGDLEGWDVGEGRFMREGIDVYTGLIHDVVQQKLTQHYSQTALPLSNSWSLSLFNC